VRSGCITKLVVDLVKKLVIQIISLKFVHWKLENR